MPSGVNADLKAAALEARKQSYSPYSKFTVGAAVESDDGRRFSGANVENASYGLSICAERTAVFAAVLAGAKKIKAIAVTGPDGVTTPPCGACRQVLAEFATPDATLAFANADGGWTDTTVGALLPHGFDAASLDAARSPA